VTSADVVASIGLIGLILRYGIDAKLFEWSDSGARELWILKPAPALRLLRSQVGKKAIPKVLNCHKPWLKKPKKLGSSLIPNWPINFVNLLKYFAVRFKVRTCRIIHAITGHAARAVCKLTDTLAGDAKYPKDPRLRVMTLPRSIYKACRDASEFVVSCNILSKN
jgi:hypothetical protein